MQTTAVSAAPEEPTLPTPVPASARALVDRTTQAQGLPAAIEDTTLLRDVARLLRPGGAPQ